MDSVPLSEMKNVGQDDALTDDDFSRADDKAVNGNNRTAEPRREQRVGLWFWAVE